jgi:hypothetical protein
MISRLEQKFENSPALPFVLALVVNGIALILSSNYLDGDAHTRTYMAIEWLRHPFFVSAPNNLTWVFGPLHCYLNAAMLSIWFNPPLAPRVLSWLLTSLTILPLYYSLRITFSKRAAFYSALLFCFFTLYVHAAAISVSEGINLLFVFLGVWLFLRFQASGSWGALLLCSLALLAANMMRYDSWPLATLITLYLAVNHLQALRKGEDSRYDWLQIITLGVVSHSFAIMWMAVSWLKLGDPLIFMHYSGNLDAPVIARRITEMGKLKYVAYNTAFLPGVMLLSLSLTSFVLSIIGIWKTLRSRPGNLILLIFELYLVYYFATFVFSFQRFPLARFTILPGAFLLCFAGVGIVRLDEALSEKWRSFLKAMALVVPLISILILGQFPQPSPTDWKEKLRAVSPITKPPEYFPKMASAINQRLTTGQTLVLDSRNFNDRLLYLDLWKHYDHVYCSWPGTESLAGFIRNERPALVLYTSTPNRNHELFTDTGDGDSVRIAGIRYRKTETWGIFTLYEIRE